MADLDYKLSQCFGISVDIGDPDIGCIPVLLLTLHGQIILFHVVDKYFSVPLDSKKVCLYAQPSLWKFYKNLVQV